MSWRDYNEPECVEEPSPVSLTLEPRPRPLGGFEVDRLLPARQRRMVGPFIFLDHMGPAHFEPGRGADVPPHPHIGLATVTYLFDGEFMHRDSLGSAQAIEPGDVNWMSAGRGIVHSERTPAKRRVDGGPLHGLQFWVALPGVHELDDPYFQHAARTDLPRIERGDATMRLVAGSAFGETSPIKTLSPLFCLDAQLPHGGRFELPADYAERALYPVDASVTVNGVACAAGALSILEPDQAVEIVAMDAPTRIVLFGGARLDGERFIWWNFVSSSKERIEAAKRDWAERRFPVVPGDEHEFVPLPRYL